MRKSAKNLALVLAVSMIPGSAVFAAEGDHYVNGKVKYSSNQVRADVAARNHVRAIPSEFEIEVDGKLYTLAEANAAFNKDQNNWKEILKGETPVEGELKVVEVSAINAKEVEVKFSKKVDKDTVISTGTTNLNTSNITITAVGGTDTETVGALSAELSKDGKALTIANATFFKGMYAVTVKDTVTDTEGNKVTPYTKTITVKDEVAPEVKEAKFDVASAKFEVEFTEPLNVSNANEFVVRVNGQPAVGVAFANNVLTFAKPADVKAGDTASIYVAGVKDFAGNTLKAYTGDVKIPADTTALSVTSVKQVSSNEFQLVFNKALKQLGTTSIVDDIQTALTIMKDGTPIVQASNWTVAIGKVDGKADKTGTVYDVSIGSGVGAPGYGLYTDTEKSVNLTLVFAKDRLQDVYGNKNPEITKTVKMLQDEAAPVAKSVKLSNDKKNLVVAFDKEVTLGTGNIVVRKDGASYTAGTAVVNTTDKTLLEIPNTGVAVYPAGTYTVRLEAGAVKDDYGNKNAAVTLSSVTVEGEAEKLAATIDNKSSTSNEFEVKFVDADGTAVKVTLETALNVANYTLDGKALPEGTDIYFKDEDNDTVYIILPKNSINIGAVGTGTNAVLGVSGIKTATGLTVEATTGTVTVEDNTPAVLEGAKLVGNTITLTFNEKLGTAPADLTDFVIKGDEDVFTAGDAIIVIAEDGKTLVITIVPKTTDNWATVKAADKITVTTAKTPATAKDANGLVIKGGVTITVEK